MDYLIAGRLPWQRPRLRSQFLDVTALLCQAFLTMWDFVRRTLLTIVIVAVAGLPFSQMSPIRAVAGFMPAASVGMPCQDAGQPLQSTGAAHSKEMPACCPIGLGCAAATSVAPETFSLIARVACACGLHAPVSDVLSGLAVPPEIRPPISSTWRARTFDPADWRLSPHSRALLGQSVLRGLPSFGRFSSR